MRKATGLGFLAILLFVVGSCLITTTLMAEETLCIPTGVLTLDPPREVEAKRSSVEFNHGLHFGYACGQCHHTWEKDAEIDGCMTVGCHDLEESPRRAGTDELPIRYYKEAYHELCIGCHRDIKIERERLGRSRTILTEQLPSTGPTGCIGCHED